MAPSGEALGAVGFMANWEPTRKMRNKMLFRTVPGELVDHILENYFDDRPAKVPNAWQRDAFVGGEIWRVVYYEGDPMIVHSVHRLTKRKGGRK
jgi:hypothetical protein